MAVPEGLVQGWRDVFTVRRVFGDPVEKGGVTVIPVAVVAGGGGGGEGTASAAEGGPQEGSGGGFGGMARPAGVYVLHDDSVEWMPALDVTKIALAAIALAVVFTTAMRGVLRHHHW